MSRSKQYQKLLNSKRWKELRIRYLREHPLCERCLREGKAEGLPFGRATAAVDLHHKIPVESTKTLTEMERLCYDWNNLEALCVPCHMKTHQELRSFGREGHKQREANRHEQRMKALIERYTKPVDEKSDK